MRDLLILGTRADPHNAWIEEDLRSLGLARVFVLDFKKSEFQLRVSGDGTYEFIVDGALLNKDFLIWDNRAIIHPGTSFYVAGDEPEDVPTRAFVAQEWRSLYRLVCSFGSGICNSLESRVLLKPRQQVLAAECGFRVPDTLVTNSRKSLLDFEASAHGPIIMKSLSSVKIQRKPDDDQALYNVMTMRVPPDDLASATDEDVGYCPHFVQREIDKDHELRVVWVDGTALAFRVDSQHYRSSAVDWRKFSQALEFSRCDLPTDTERKIEEFMRTAGLFCGSLDLIVDKDGKYWFVECNGEGAWGWLDLRSNGEIRRLFAEKIYNRLQ